MEPSTVKVHRAIGRLFAELPNLQQQASGLNAIMLAPLMSFAPRLEAELLERVPTDPAILDALLERAAQLVLELRSDNAHGVRTTYVDRKPAAEAESARALDTLEAGGPS